MFLKKERRTREGEKIERHRVDISRDGGGGEKKRDREKKNEREKKDREA